MHLATPDMGAGPAVIVIPEDRELCDLLAAEGFTALAPELSQGQTAQELSAAIDFLKPHPAVRGQGIGVIGSGTGAGLALWLGTHRPEDVVAVVAVSGTVPPEAERPDWSRLRAAVQGHFGENDPTCLPDVIAPLEESLGEGGVTVEFFTYPMAGPRFFEEDGDAARQAWIRTLEFLRKHLG
ncbi:MAG TPA: dienelactone hydrolase family protein [Acidimicrobiia bacterium]|jgi:carboxymethylenebutenolidase|nr:dienelactone hydrolase family protein [Acidimicrobiia bacterium]